MTYRGPQNIPLEWAEKLIEALNPILDLLAEEPSRPKQFTTNYRLEENRWALWRAVQIAHEAAAGQGGTKVWRGSPIRRRHETELVPQHLVGPWWELRCGRPTKKNEPCKMKLRHGRAYCWRHSTVEENETLRIWQDKIHLPYPRVDVGRFVFDKDELIDDLQAIVASLA